VPRYPRLPLLAAAILALALVAACSGDSNDDAAPAVRPFSEVQATDFVFESDPSDPNRAIFRMETTEPMICAIVWGETEALGNFNNSLAMNGTGIVAHDVFLPGAAAGSTYFYRVQGSTADGTLYQSPLATFTVQGDTAAAPGGAATPAPVGANLAPAGTVTAASSQFSDAWAGANAIDDDLTTEWSSLGSGDDAFITVDLGQSQPIGGVEYLTRSMADGSAITTTFTVIPDGGAPLGPFEASTPARPAIHLLDIQARELRFEVENSTGGNTGAIEVRVFAPE